MEKTKPNTHVCANEMDFENFLFSFSISNDMHNTKTKLCQKGYVLSTHQYLPVNAFNMFIKIATNMHEGIGMLWLCICNQVQR